MRIRSVQAYVIFLAAAAAACLYVQDWTPLVQLPVPRLVGFVALVLLGMLSESVSVSFRVAQSSGHSSITFIPFLASVVLFGPAAGVLLATAITLVGEFVLHPKPWTRATFNVAQWIAATSAAGYVYLGLTNTLSLSSGPFPQNLSGGLIFLPFFACVFAFFLVNYVAVAGAIALDKGTPLRHVLGGLIASAGPNLFYGILLSPLAFVVALLYEHFGLGGLLLTVLPLVFIRHSYLTTLKLQKANQDLLKALVKAIETRDPYTSGHSLRVSALARRIGQKMNLSLRKIEEIEQAALLHDIGKIDAIYSPILQKPDSLSREERAIIESHVTKGVELLRSISSFPAPVIAAVRHHHEREDGKGYPDGLTGDGIPLGAKIIKVCDAIDAMLSDRPYRSALSLDQVRVQLEMYAGSQFDKDVVHCIAASSILKEHQKDVADSRNWSSFSVLDEDIKTEGRSSDQITSDSIIRRRLQPNLMGLKQGRRI